MREIKFRAWHLDDGMLYFDFDSFAKDYHNQYENIMQYTELKDPLGKEIYDGDILSKVPVNELGKNVQYFYVVIWSSSDVCFCCKQYVLDENEEGEYWRRKDDLFDNIIMVKTYNHVIGNIYENPELLK